MQRAWCTRSPGIRRAGRCSTATSTSRTSTALRRLTTAPELDDQASWSPDGRRIAFRSHRTGDWDIWVMNADGSGQMNLVDSQLPARGTEHSPEWSPDGTRIVYASDIDALAYSKLWTMRPDGSDERRLLPQAAATFEVDRDPSWSPDGSLIAFTSNHEGLLSHVYTMKPDGSGVVRYTSGVDEHVYPRWLRTALPAGQPWPSPAGHVRVVGLLTGHGPA